MINNLFVLTYNIIYDIIIILKDGKQVEIEIELGKQATKYLNKCDTKTYTKLNEALDELKKLDGDIKRLSGYKDTYRMKVPPYRILFTYEKSSGIIKVRGIYPRGDAYKKGVLK